MADSNPHITAAREYERIAKLIEEDSEWFAYEIDDQIFIDALKLAAATERRLAVKEIADDLRAQTNPK